MTELDTEGFSELAMGNTNHMAGPNGGWNAENDKHLRVVFSYEPKQDKAASVEAGRPIFNDIAFITIYAAGSRDTVARPVRPADKQRFAVQFKQFEAKEEQTVEGTPLSAWPAITRSQVEEMKYFNIHTVEQLIDLPANQAMNIMGVATLQRKAEAFIKAATGSAPIEQMAADIEELKRVNAQLIADLSKAKKPSKKAKTTVEEDG
tara:strand:- start:24061 stop:24678 length:618 start_codon:yes stop_codon:yes gene_type:complete